MRTFLRLLQVEFSPADHHIMPVADEVFDHVLQAQGSRTSVHQSDIVHGEAGLQRSVFEQGIQHHIRVRADLELDDDTHSLPGGLVVHIDDTVHFLVLHQFDYLLDKLPFVHHIRDLGHYDGFPAGFAHLDFSPGSDDYPSAACLERISYALMSLDDTSRREIRPLYIMHEFIGGDIGVVDVRTDGIAGLSQIVRSHVGRHTDRNTRRTVQQQERSLGRKYGRLLKGIVEVVLEIDGILVDICHHFFGELFEFRLSVTHGCRRVAVHGTEVSLAENERISHAPRLRHPDHGIIHAAVTVRMVFTQHLTDYSGRFLRLAGIVQSESRHTEKHPSVDRFHTVPHIRQCPGHYDRHGIVDIRTAHLSVDIDRLDPSCRSLRLYLINFIIHKNSPEFPFCPVPVPAMSFFPARSGHIRQR